MRVPVDAGSATRLAAERDRLLDQPARGRRVAGKVGERGGPALDVRRQRAQLRRRGHVQPPVEAGHDLAGLDVPEVGEVLPVQPLEQQRVAARVGPQQRHRTVAVPVLEGQVLVLGLVVGEADLQHRGPAGHGADGDDQGAEPVRRLTVEGQLPVARDLGDQPGQPVDPPRPVVAEGRLGAQPGGHVEGQGGHAAIVPGLPSGRTRAACRDGRPTRPRTRRRRRGRPPAVRGA